jgi:hypothetical protein
MMRCMMAMTWTRYSSLFSIPKADIWKLVPSGNLTLIFLVYHFSCRSAGGTYGMGGQMNNFPYLHSKSFNSSGGDLRLELMAPCQSGVSKIRGLNTDLGGTCKIPGRGYAGNFAICKILTFVGGSLVDLPGSREGLVSCAPEQSLQQMPMLM